MKKIFDTRSMINYLPFASDFKLDLLEKFDKLSNDEQTRITDLVWDAFELVYNTRVSENMDKLIASADKNGQKTDDTFYTQAVEMTDNEIRQGLNSATEIVDLAEVRKSMELIVKEIKASQQTPILKN